ncbi:MULTISPECIES: 6-phosphofructokinase [unclassified Streptomyces]|uniref:6-phosphofructokinase n=1 Tax=unclassified Streptomyces TaxID=2593676 RepID=UPI003D70F2E2
MRVGVLTGGRDCPGLNAVVRAVVRKGVQEYGHEFVGFVDGWRGALDGDTVPLDIPAVRGTLPRGGTILGTSRTHPLDYDNGVRRIRDNLAKHDVEALITIGGRDTLGTAARLADEHGLPCVAVPKTIDNDLPGTDYTLGFDTAVGVATGAIDRLHTTAESHKRVLVVEVMGGDAGWIALHSGLAGGANVILIPEQPFDVDQVCAWVTSRFRASYAPIVVVGDGARPRDGHVVLTPSGSGQARLSGVGEWLAREIEGRTGKEARTTVLGHLQRGGSPSPYDRWLATRFGLHAIDAAHEGDFGTMVALRGPDVVRVPIATATGAPKTVDPQLYTEVGVFFG